MPQKYPYVLQDTKNTPRTKTMGVMVYVSNWYRRNRFNAKAASILNVLNAYKDKLEK